MSRLRSELRAETLRQLAFARSALAAAKADGAPQYEQGQLRAAIRRLQDDLAALAPRRAKRVAK